MRFLITFIALFLFVVFIGLASSCVEERPAEPGCCYGTPFSAKLRFYGSQWLTLIPHAIIASRR